METTQTLRIPVFIINKVPETLVYFLEKIQDYVDEYNFSLETDPSVLIEKMPATGPCIIITGFLTTDSKITGEEIANSAKVKNKQVKVYLVTEKKDCQTQLFEKVFNKVRGDSGRLNAIIKILKNGHGNVKKSFTWSGFLRKRLM